MQTVAALLDQQAILNTIYQLYRAFDEQNWVLLRACLANWLECHNQEDTHPIQQKRKTKNHEQSTL